MIKRDLYDPLVLLTVCILYIILLLLTVKLLTPCGEIANMQTNKYVLPEIVTWYLRIIVQSNSFISLQFAVQDALYFYIKHNSIIVIDDTVHVLVSFILHEEYTERSQVSECNTLQSITRAHSTVKNFFPRPQAKKGPHWGEALYKIKFLYSSANFLLDQFFCHSKSRGDYYTIDEAK